MLVKAYAEQHGQPQKSDETKEQTSKKTKSATIEKKDQQKKDKEQGSQSPFGLVMFHFM